MLDRPAQRRTATRHGLNALVAGALAVAIFNPVSIAGANAAHRAGPRDANPAGANAAHRAGPSDANPAGAPSSPAARARQAGPTAPAELEDFLDEYLSAAMAEHHIAGAAVAVVKDGELFFSKGYGSADLANNLPVDPEVTAFRIGSISKLFAWTAVMQLVEQGKLDLDEDVNSYLDFEIPDTFPQPITLRNLLTHTSGFEDRLLGSVASDPAELLPVAEGIHSIMPQRVRPPGEAVGYTNFNAVLAGYIVARVSGLPYEEYVQEHILDPLGMTHSTAKFPLPPEIASHESIGYGAVEEDSSGESLSALEPYPYYLPQPAGLPSGAIRASANDMAHFMIAFLEGGRLQAERDDLPATASSAPPDQPATGAAPAPPGTEATAGEPEAGRILTESTAREMLEPLFAPDPRLRGLAHGFANLSENGELVFGHQGYYPPMHSVLLLVPDRHLGVFAAFNSLGADQITAPHAGLQKAFFDHYFPTSPPAPIDPPPDFAERASRFTGPYRYASAPATTLIKIVELFGAYRAEITDPGDGTLTLAINGQNRRVVEVEPLDTRGGSVHFRDLDGDFGLVFTEDANGNVVRANTDFMPWYTLVKLHWYDTARFHLGLLAACFLAFLSIIPVALIRALRRRGADDKSAAASPRARLAYRLLVAICLLNIAFVLGTVMWGNPPTELGSLTPRAKAVLGLGVIAAVLTIGALAFAALAWLRRYWSTSFRIYYTFVTVAAVAFVWFLDYWNLLGWRY